MSRRSILLGQTMSDSERQNLQKIIYQIEQNPDIYEQLSEEQVLGIICIILNKSSYHRSFAEMDILKKATKSNEYFQNMINQPQGELLWERCLRKMTYNFLPIGFNLFREGDAGTTFYIILQGRVSIHKKYQVGVNQFEERELTQLHKGQSFGELALENDAPRSASVKALNSTHLAVLEKEDYMIIKKTLSNQQKQMYFEEFAKLSIFSDWKFTNIKGLFDNVKFHQYGLNHQIYKEGDQSNQVYFIQQGELKVIKYLQLIKQNNQNQIQIPTNCDKQLKDSDEINQLQELSVFHKKQLTNSEKIDELFQKKKYGHLIQVDKRQTITLKYIGAGEMFGELEILKNQEIPRQVSVITTQEQNKIYSIHKKDFLRVLYFDQVLHQNLVYLNDNKLKQILHQIKGFQKNFFDKQDKQQLLETTQNKDFLTLDYKEYEEQQQNQKKISSSKKNISLRNFILDNKTQDIGLTLQQKETFTNRNQNLMFHKHTLSDFKLNTDRVLNTNSSSKTNLKIRSNNQSPDSSSIQQLKLNLCKYQQTSPLSRTSRMLSPQDSIFSKSQGLRKFQNSQIYFNNTLPFIMQNRYIRIKSNLNKIQCNL
ncbi:unnamed protein product [Paramecium pentaurelia]|uniref:Cyclic nucleotide-binding domain-containing protein n=1 Tax=Paramecium pentaurelia TaxID=43138 RepID=A0A8S1SSS6_9CILI|nr:unnamed protein product [Paramecium pentaurelia]